MRKNPMKRALALALAAGLLAAGAYAGEALAYFTSYTEAEGTQPIRLRFTTTIPEDDVYDWTKHVVVTNTGIEDCYVRARAYAAEPFQSALVYEGNRWSPGADGWYYYSEIVPAGETVPEEDELLIHVDNLDAEADFNVIVVEECTKVLHDSEGAPYADWDLVLEDIGDDEGGGE